MENCELVGAGEASGVAIFAHLGVRCPAASLMDGATARVEVYRVPDDEAMAGLDKLECYPEWYNRDLLPITLSDSGAKTKAWLVRERAWPCPRGHVTRTRRISAFEHEWAGAHGVRRWKGF